MRKFCILTGILLSLFFTACKQFSTDIDDYLSYWAAEAYITDSTIMTAVQNDVNGIASVASAGDVTVTLKVRNPKAFRFVIPSATETRNIVGFARFTGTKPVAGTDYTLVQSDDRNSLTLTYSSRFLQENEWGERGLSSVITLYADDGRVFK